MNDDDDDDDDDDDVLNNSSLVSLLQGSSLRVAVSAAAPAVIEAYAVLMFFAALGKFNTSFFDGKRSAATAHVIGSLENIFALLPAPCAQFMSSLVRSAGPNGMMIFFVSTAWLGAIVESAVCLLMYLNYPVTQVWMMYAMHGIFAFTAFDFSVASSGVLPLFGSPVPGAVSKCLGWLSGPLGRIVVPAILIYVMMTPATAPAKTAKTAETNGTGPASHAGGHMIKLMTLTMLCRGWYFLSAPVMYIPPYIPPGAMLLRLGTDERLAQEQATVDALGPWGALTVRCGAFVTLAICVMNGLGPYGGWKTAGTFTTLYSNILIERDANPWLWPLVRAIGMPWCTMMTDLATVIETDAPEIRVRISVAQITRLVVFKDLMEWPEWKLSAFCHWAPVPPAWHTLLEYASPELRSTPVIPYEIPWVQLRVLCTDIIASNPERDFFVEYVYEGKRRRFSRRKGVTHHNSDIRLATRPSLLQRCCAYRAIPADDARDLVHTS